MLASVVHFTITDAATRAEIQTTGGNKAKLLYARVFNRLLTPCIAKFISQNSKELQSRNSKIAALVHISYSEIPNL